VTPQQLRWFAPIAVRLSLRQEAEDRFRRPHMTTPPGVGYYELLEQHPNNILIGYSQGGLVARYLAFLDRHVFKKNIITGFLPFRRRTGALLSEIQPIKTMLRSE